jgi:hypothetical protein
MFRPMVFHSLVRLLLFSWVQTFSTLCFQTFILTTQCERDQLSQPRKTANKLEFCIFSFFPRVEAVLNISTAALRVAESEEKGIRCVGI